MAIALVAQFRLRRYVPGVYWLSVVLISVVGTLLTDNLTDGHNVPLWISTTVFAALLAVVFGIWYSRERTLSIHTIVTTPREAFYWLAVLVTFALGTAAGDWTLELTGWSPGAAVLLPLGLILAVLAAWKLGAGPVLSFWVAYILTRPLGANIGDFLGSPHKDGGLGLGTLGTSVLFLGTILAVVIYLTRTRRTAPRSSPSLTRHASDCGRGPVMTEPRRPASSSSPTMPSPPRPCSRRSPIGPRRVTCSSGSSYPTRRGQSSICSTPNATTRRRRPSWCSARPSRCWSGRPAGR